MNTERILKLADVIEAAPHMPIDLDEAGGPLVAFNMADYHCGTVGCIAGWAAQLFGGIHCEPGTSTGELLGLERKQSERLFRPAGVDRWRSILPSEAAAVLRHLASTGEVEWPVAGGEA